MTVKTPPAGQGHPAGELEHLLPGRDARGSEELPGALSAELARGEGQPRDPRRWSIAPALRTARCRPASTPPYLKKAIGYLEKARDVAEPAQATALADLIRFYQTGDPKDWLQFGGDWVRNDATVDFANGFIEVYRDPRGAKGASQSFVTITDKPVTNVMVNLAKNAAYFEDKAPWNAEYKKRDFTPPVVKAVEVLIETGDFHVGTIGVNLPNEQEIHAEIRHQELPAARQQPRAQRRRRRRHRRVRGVARRGAAREGARRGRRGHADGDARGHRPRVGQAERSRARRRPAKFLKEYYSTLEEARADLMGLWNIWDPKLKELNLVKDQDEIAKAMYDSAARAPLTQLRRIPKGDTIEEDHQRDRQLIAHYIRDKTGRDRILRQGRQDLRPGEGLPEDARGRRAAARRADAHQGGRGLRRRSRRWSTPTACASIRSCATRSWRATRS